MINIAEKTKSKKSKGKVNVAEVNIGLVGHVDCGKTTLTEAITGEWTDTHSEELKRGITIRLGYADATFYKCKKCGLFGTSPKCPSCFGECTQLRTVSFVDVPGHETLMATVLTGAALMDGALLVIAANEPCPQPQTAEHLATLDIVGIKNIVIVQNKIDLVSEEEAKENYEEIKKFVNGSVAENAPIIPVSAQQGIGVSALIDAIEDVIKTKERDLKKKTKMCIVRSFDINKPGTPIDSLVGGVIGGSLIDGVLKVGDEIEIKPGIKTNSNWSSIKTKIKSIHQGGLPLNEGTPGGLIALGTGLDPAMTKSDSLVGNIVGMPGQLPKVWNELVSDVKLLERIIGTKEKEKTRITENDVVMINVSTGRTIGTCKKIEKKKYHFELKRPICADPGDKIAISKQVMGRWRLVGWAVLE